MSTSIIVPRGHFRELGPPQSGVLLIYADSLTKLGWNLVWIQNHFCQSNSIYMNYALLLFVCGGGNREHPFYLPPMGCTFFCVFIKNNCQRRVPLRVVCVCRRLLFLLKVFCYVTILKQLKLFLYRRRLSYIFVSLLLTRADCTSLVTQIYLEHCDFDWNFLHMFVERIQNWDYH